MGIEKRIDAYLDGRKEPGAVSDPVDLVAAIAIARHGDENRGEGMRDNPQRGCLSDEEIAAFVDHKQEFPGYEKAVRHMAGCASCRSRAR